MSLLDSLISYWKLDESSGNAIDAHGSNDLTDTNTVTSATGVVNNARDFERGNAEYFTIADNSEFRTGNIDFTFTCWLKLESTGTEQNVLGKWTGSVGLREYLLQLTAANVLRWGVSENGNSSTFVNWSSGPSTATWYFVVMWHDAATNVVGIVVNDATPVTAAHTTGVQSGNTAPFRIGNQGTGSNTVDGLIDEVGYWKRLLTTEEKTALYNSGAGLSYDSFGAARRNPMIIS